MPPETARLCMELLQMNASVSAMKCRAPIARGYCALFVSCGILSRYFLHFTTRAPVSQCCHRNLILYDAKAPLTACGGAGGYAILILIL